MSICLKCNIAVQVLTIFVFSRPLLFARPVQLGWSASKHPEVSHYGIYRSTYPDSSFHLISWLEHPDSTYIDEDIDLHFSYLYAVTAVDSFGKESDFSNIVKEQGLSLEDLVIVQRSHRQGRKCEIMVGRQWKVVLGFSGLRFCTAMRLV
jgi:fibronectin type 3 domain-containing protein